ELCIGRIKRRDVLLLKIELVVLHRRIDHSAVRGRRAVQQERAYWKKKLQLIERIILATRSDRDAFNQRQQSRGGEVLVGIRCRPRSHRNSLGVQDLHRRSYQDQGL